MSKIKLNDIIIYEDDDYLGINKPPFLSTLEDRNSPDNALTLVRKSYPDIKVCHRIDKETSGVLLFAKTLEALSHASSKFEKREVKKEYHAVIDSNKPIEMIRADLPIRVLANGKVYIDKLKGKESATIFNTLEIYKYHSLVACYPLTGRMHQIRVHLSYMDYPIVNDELYGGEMFMLSRIKSKFKLKKGTTELPLVKRFALHAHSLNFINRNNQEISITAPYPKDFAVLVKQLRLNP